MGLHSEAIGQALIDMEVNPASPADLAAVLAAVRRHFGLVSLTPATTEAHADAAAVERVFKALGNRAAEQFEAIVLDAGLLDRCAECGWNIPVSERGRACEECGSRRREAR